MSPDLDCGRRSDRGHVHRDQRVGARGDGRGARDPHGEAPLPHGCADLVVFAGSLPRSPDRVLRGRDPRPRVARRASRPRQRGRGATPRVQAGLYLVSPNQREAEQLVGQELEDDDDFLMALDAIAEMGARNVVITLENGCFALLRLGRKTRRLRAFAPHVEPVSGVGPETFPRAAACGDRRGSDRRTTQFGSPSLQAPPPCGRLERAASTLSSPRRSRPISSSRSSSPSAPRLRV